ncbi:MAG TPA: MurR/RpiR family transcriptional regulator [Aliidongia sp.]|uniref:MurR/RpiR family transcriptional regulator n=1 Tax=Aliidongia sp. TaxID=1914230 RepID=UPI002DDD281C|nr:MurR/RpiR family transcriptional regulator [Aliidongia sp.]HEV2674939.1 MurR/RpiR family transcriptional regulator [Aliidongia sp.]
MSPTVDIAQHIAQRFETLTPQQRRAARFLLDHPTEVALKSMRELAQGAGVPPVTFVRLARALDFADYNALRAVFQGDVRQDRTRAGFSQKARDLQLRSGGDKTQALVKELFEAELDNIELTFSQNHPDQLIAAADLMERARRLFVLGRRSCHPTAAFFHYVHRLFRANAVLVPDGGQLVDCLRDAGPDDVLLVVSVAPYTADTVEAARWARERGTRLIAITDDRLSPIGRLADVVLMVGTATPSFFHSIVPMVALAQALLALLVARGGDAALAAIEASELQLNRFQVYWTDGDQEPTP